MGEHFCGNPESKENENKEFTLRLRSHCNVIVMEQFVLWACGGTPLPDVDFWADWCCNHCHSMPVM